MSWCGIEVATDALVPGSIAGFPTDVLIIDDFYKDNLEANHACHDPAMFD